MTIHEGRTDCKPEDVSYRPEKLNDLDSLFKNLIESKKLLSASYLLARHGKIFAAKSMGKLNYKSDSPDYMPDSLRYIASISKVYTAVAIMQLVEKGKIYLTQAVSTIIPEFDNPMYKTVSIFHLLTHTSGLTADEGYFTEPFPRNDSERMKTENWIEVVLSGKAQSKPGEQWSYCSKGFLILGEIIKRVSGVPYETYIENEIIKRMGLKNTFLSEMPQERFKDNCLTSAEEEAFVCVNEASPFPKAAGDIVSDLYDLYSIGQMFINKGSFNGTQILSRKSVEAMTKNHLNNVPAFYWGGEYRSKIYGIGLDLYDLDFITTPGTFGHEGAGRSALICDPKEELVFVYFTPSIIDFVAESVINPRAIAWAGLM